MSISKSPLATVALSMVLAGASALEGTLSARFDLCGGLSAPGRAVSIAVCRCMLRDEWHRSGFKFGREGPISASRSPSELTPRRPSKAIQ